MKPGTILLTIAFVIFLVAGLDGQSSGQQRFPPSNRKPACGCYVCGLLLAVDFPNKDKDCAGILATDACPQELARMPAAARNAACQQLKAKSKGGSLDACLILKHACETGEDPLPEKCQPPGAPWLGPGSDCKDAQAWQVTQNRGSVSVSVCGQNVFTNPHVGTDPIFSAAYIGALKDHLRRTVGEKVCCGEFREGSRAGAPCDPRKDLDCDGKPNSEDDSRKYPDDTSYFPTIDRFPTAGDATIDPFPPGLSVDEIYPNAETCKDCQWELKRGELKCDVATPDGPQHVYQAKWKCPSTGVEVDTFKYAPVTAPCKSIKVQ